MNELCYCHSILHVKHFVCLDKLLTVVFELATSLQKLLIRYNHLLDNLGWSIILFFIRQSSLKLTLLLRLWALDRTFLSPFVHSATSWGWCLLCRQWLDLSKECCIITTAYTAIVIDVDLDQLFATIRLFCLKDKLLLIITGTILIAAVLFFEVANAQLATVSNRYVGNGSPGGRRF